MSVDLERPAGRPGSVALQADVGTPDVDAFKEAFRRYPSGVVLVTADVEGPGGVVAPVGLTASSLASVAADPPALSFSVSGGRSADAVATAEAVSVHVLPDTRADLATAFATSGAPRFTPEQGWTRTVDGAWRLTDALATLSGPVVAVVPVGSSRLLVVQVADVDLGPRSAPLVHHDRTYRRLA